jgi:hypothetical protein
MQTISPFTTVSYQLSMATDPLLGPYTTWYSEHQFWNITIRVYQLTAGPKTNVTVSFGDGTANKSYILTSSYVNITYSYQLAGPFNISITAAAVDLTGLTYTSNILQVYITLPPVFFQTFRKNIYFSLLLCLNLHFKRNLTLCNDIQRKITLNNTIKRKITQNHAKSQGNSN